MRKPLMLAMVVLMVGCAETPPEPPAVTTSAALTAPAPKLAEPAPRKDAAIPVPSPKPRTVVYLDIVPPDSGLEQAVREALRDRAAHIELRRGTVASGDAALLSLRHFRWSEDERPEEVRTVTYRRDQVSGHVLPVGATYQVDHVVGTVTVGVSVRLSLERGGKKLAESEVSDRVEAPWSTCRLARIVEPTGAAKAARFVANADMQALCGGKPAAVTPNVAVKLADAVLALPMNGK